MAIFNRAAGEVFGKIVFYGPGRCGKTTNLEYVAERLDPSTRGRLYTLKTEQDRTLLFDMMPVDAGTIGRFQLKFQIYTVPGQVYYNASRTKVLQNADGIVFVADSGPTRLEANIESMHNLYDNLAQLGIEPEDVGDPEVLPMVIQYNKRDLPGALPIDALEEVLNYDALPAWEAVATEGVGVFETLGEVVRLTEAKLRGEIR